MEKTSRVILFLFFCILASMLSSCAFFAEYLGGIILDCVLLDECGNNSKSDIDPTSESTINQEEEQDTTEQQQEKIAGNKHQLDKTENRCGWLENPTPANWWLTDRDGTWTISVQGGYQANGMNNMPPMGEREYVRTNGNYGYTCACLRVVTDGDEMRIISIQNGEQLSLKTCHQDPNLPENP